MTPCEGCDFCEDEQWRNELYHRMKHVRFAYRKVVAA